MRFHADPQREQPEFVHRLPRLRCGRRILFDRKVLDEYVDYFQPDQDISIDKRIGSG